ncbi:MAG: exosortase/archaeosortase family protein, partial [Promethearchaeota archaeon]
VFAGLILPLPRGTWPRKILAVIVVTIMLFVANFVRVVYEIWLVYWGILPWELAHYPMSFVLGVVGVFILCIVAIVLVPGFIETFEDMIYYLFPPKSEEIPNSTEEKSRMETNNRLENSEKLDSIIN